MCNVNINLTLQFFFPNFFIIYKILTSPFLGRFLQHEDIGSTKLFISPYLAVSIKSQFVFFHDG